MLTWLFLFMNNYKIGVQMFCKILNSVFFQVFIALKHVVVYAAVLFQIVSQNSCKCWFSAISIYELINWIIFHAVGPRMVPESFAGVMSWTRDTNLNL